MQMNEIVIIVLSIGIAGFMIAMGVAIAIDSFRGR